jgi:hypothetical protein
MADEITLSTVGNYRIISYNAPFTKVKSFDGYIIDTSNEIPNVSYLHKEFRWSLNNNNWSLWMEATDSNIATVDCSSGSFYLEFKFTLTSGGEESISTYSVGENIVAPVTINDFQPAITYDQVDPRNFAKAPVPLCSKEMYTNSIIFQNCDPNALFKPYDVNRGINVYQDLSKAVNLLFGHDVNYYSIQPNGRGKDVVLREYNLFDVVDEKCIKVMVNQNIFPDNKPVYDSFGILFDAPLEISIDRKYFESIFGKGSQPRKRDIIFFPLTNRIYQIESTYLHRDFNLYPVFFKCQLMKYEVKQNTSWNNTQAEQDLLDYTVNTEDLFGAETQEEINKNTKPQQYFVSSQRRGEDPARAYVSKNLPIIEFDLNNNWTIVFNTYYDLETLTYNDPNYYSEQETSVEAVRYRALPALNAGDEFSFTCWFKVRNYINKNRLVNKPSNKIPITSYTQGSGTITYSTHPVTHKLNLATVNSDGYVSILADSSRTGGFRILDIVDQYSFTVKDDGSNISGSTTNWKMQKAQARTLFYGRNNDQGIHLQMIWTGSNETQDSTDYLQVGSFRALINELEILSPFGAGIDSENGPFIPQLSDWYGFVFNFSNSFRQYSMNVWEMLYNPENPAAQTSDLGLVHLKEGLLTKKYIYNLTSDVEQSNQVETFQTDNNAYKLLGSPVYLANIRLFKSMLAAEKQSAILNQNIVIDSQLATIIDNAKIILKLPKIAKNR